MEGHVVVSLFLSISLQYCLILAINDVSRGTLIHKVPKCIPREPRGHWLKINRGLSLHVTLIFSQTGTESVRIALPMLATTCVDSLSHLQNWSLPLFKIHLVRNNVIIAKGLLLLELMIPPHMYWLGSTGVVRHSRVRVAPGSIPGSAVLFSSYTYPSQDLHATSLPCPSLALHATHYLSATYLSLAAFVPPTHLSMTTTS
jgi:hypothetical protein